MLRIALTAAVAGALLSPAVAQTGTPDTENGRHSFTRVEDGFLRLDQRTGKVSLCSRRNLGWACHPIADERAALEEEIARLQKDNAGLKQELLSRNLPLPGSIKPESPTAQRPDRGIKPPDAADIDRAVAYAEQIWKRLVEMISRLQRDIFTQI